VRREQNGAVVVQIARKSDWLMYIFMLAAFTAAFSFFASVFVSPFFRKPLSSRDLILLPFIGFILLWYFIAVRVGMWRSFGVEEILIENGMFSWTRAALFWKRKLELPVAEIEAIETVTPWHDLSNHVEFVTRGRRSRIGDMLRRDETYEVADVLRRATRPQE
jgi:hypothetical protein